MKTEILEIITQHKFDHLSSEQTVSELLDLFAVSGMLFCHLKESADNETTLIRQSEKGLKYIIASDDLISYGRVGKKIGESECIHFDGTNGKKILQEWAK